MGKNRNGRENTQGKNTQKYEKMRKDEEVFRGFQKSITKLAHTHEK